MKEFRTIKCDICGKKEAGIKLYKSETFGHLHFCGDCRREYGDKDVLESYEIGNVILVK